MPPRWPGIREDLIFPDIATGRTLRRAGWQELMSRLRPGDTLAVAFLDRLSRNFEDGVRIQADLTERNIGIVALRGEHRHQRRQRRRGREGCVTLLGVMQCSPATVKRRPWPLH